VSETKKKKGWPRIGSLRKSEDGTSYIKLEANVEILVDGVKIPLNDKKTVRLECPRKNVESMRDRGYITEQQAGERLEKLAEMTWLRYDLIAPPPKPT